MARSRNIKPALFADDILADASPAARLLFIGLWTLADFRGNLEYRPKRIKAAIFPYDGDELNIIDLMYQLYQTGTIRFYTGSTPGLDRVYVNIRKFGQHQNPHKKEVDAGSDIPEYTDADLQAIESIRDLYDSRSTPGNSRSIRADSLIPLPDPCFPLTDPCFLITDTLQEKNEDNIPEQIQESPKVTDVSAKGNRFEEWWDQYPKKVGKKACRKIWKSRGLDKIADTIIADTIKRPTACCTWKKGFITNPQTYLNGDRWEDDFNTDDPAGSASRAVDNSGAIKSALDKFDTPDPHPLQNIFDDPIEGELE